MTCTTCGTENPAGAKFCMSCGHTLAAVCPSCATTLPEGARFCFKCGFELEVGATAGMTGETTEDVASRLADEVAAVTAAVGERRNITMLFVDVVGSTAAAEQLDPEAWAAVMSAAFDQMIQPVERYGGSVARLLGDAILAYFGAPDAHEDDPQRAVLAALEILDFAQEHAAAVRAQHGIDFAVRIGINTGLVVVGEVGSEMYGEYAALGDAANTAARMQQIAEPGTVVVAEPTHRLVAPLFDFEPLGGIDVKGKAEPVAAFRALARRADPGRLRGIEGLSSPVVGRVEEIERLRAALGALRSGRGQVVCIMGEAGLGKSRLTAELYDEATADGDLSWIVGQSYSYDTTTPFGPVVDLLEMCFGIEQDDSDAQRLRKIEELEGKLLGDGARQDIVLLATLLGVPVGIEDEELTKHLFPPQVRELTFVAVERHLAAIAERNPVVVVFDDLHWADPASIEMVERLLALTDRARIMVLAAFRPRRSEPSWGIRETASRDYPHRYTGIDLRPLDDDESRELLANLLRVEGLDVSVRATILAKAEGNPFFVEEVIRSLLDDGTIVAEGERFVATREIQDFTVPDTLGAVIATRLDQLDPDSKRLLQTASVIGRDFSYDVLAALSDPAIDVAAVVTDLQRRELVFEKQRSPEVMLRFKHALTMDTAYESLLLSVRKELHRIVAGVLEEREPDRVTDLARHFLRAELPSRALPYLVASGDQMARAHSMDDAVGQYRRAVELWTKEDPVAVARKAYEGLGNAHTFQGDVPGAVNAFEEMLAFGEEHGDIPTQVSALNKLGFTVSFFGADFERSEQLLLRAKELAEAADDRSGLVEFHTNFCIFNTNLGRLDEAADHLQDMAVVGEEIDSSYHRVFGMAHYANTKVLMLDFAEGREAAAEALAVAEEEGERSFVAEIIGEIQPTLDLAAGNVEDALKHAMEGLAVAQEIGALLVTGYTAAPAAMIALLLGRYEEAQELATTAEETATTIGALAPAGLAAAALSEVERVIYGGSGPRHGDVVARAVEYFQHPIAGQFAAAAFAVIGNGAVHQGNWELAERCLDLGRTVPSATRGLAKPALLLCSASVAMHRGDQPEATALVHEAAAFADEHGLRWLQPKAQLGVGAITALGGDIAAGAAIIEDAAADATQMRMLPQVLDIHTQAARYLGELGATDLAAHHRQAALETVAEIAGMFTASDMRKAYLKTNAVT